MRRSLEGRQTNAPTRRVQYPEGTIIRSYQSDGAFEHYGSYLAKIGSRVQGVGNFEQRVGSVCFSLLVGIEPRVLVANRQLPGDGLKKCDLLIEPGARGAGVM